MEFNVKQVSSLEKIRKDDVQKCEKICKRTVLPGERFSYQICIWPDEFVKGVICTEVKAESSLGDCVKLYTVRDAYIDVPYTESDFIDEDYLTHEPCFMPEVLVPIEDQRNICSLGMRSTFWVKVDVPGDVKPGKHSVKVIFTQISKASAINLEQPIEICAEMEVEVVAANIEPQKLIYTRWFYADCIAEQHNVEIYSEKHWELIDKYIAAAADVGVNMILVPTHTPPLDTAVGITRPCVQLVDIEKKGDTYEFSFEKFTRFINICKKNGIKYYEMAHMFSQWGAMCAPNIMVTENCKKDYMFGWHVSASSVEYVEFLKQYIAAIAKALEAEGISENTYFHISDEPTMKNIDTYKTASEIIRPLIGASKTFDALSHYDFYEEGLVECPVTAVAHMNEFLQHDIPNQWTYYCGGPQTVFTNSLMAMPSYRVRILGFLLYKYNIKGFLHWGLNYYNSRISYYPINPYMTTSSDGAFPSGDGYILYPSRDGVYGSIRGEVTYEAIQDMDICRTLEKYIGRDAVVEMIDAAAGFELRFDQYPKGNAFIEGLRAQMIEKIRETM